MARIVTLGILLTLVATTFASDVPAPSTTVTLTSADVVTARLELNTLADDLKSYRVTLKIANGWHLYANLEGRDDKVGKYWAIRHPDAVTVVGYFADGKRVWMHSTHYPKRTTQKDAAGKEYFAYERTAGITTWLDYEVTKQAKVVTVRVRVIATNGRIKLKESVVMASFRGE